MRNSAKAVLIPINSPVEQVSSDWVMGKILLFYPPHTIYKIKNHNLSFKEDSTIQMFKFFKTETMPAHLRGGALVHIGQYLLFPKDNSST